MSLLSKFKKKPAFQLDFNDGPCLEIISEAAPHKVIMRENQSVLHEDEIEGKHWTRAHRKYFTNWHLEVFDDYLRKIFEHKFELRNKNVRINIDSRSLGDTLAWLPQVQLFAQQHSTSKIYVSQFWDTLFNKAAYPELIFIDPKSTVENCYATYNIGFYFEHVEWHHPVDPRTVPLGKVAADILGIPYFEERPVLAPVDTPVENVSAPYVCVATASTAECKHWLYPGGWQSVIDYLKQNGLETMVIQKEDTTLERINNQTGEQPLSARIQQISNCELFIGLGSGLSWLAWAVGKPVILIAGFSEPYTEFKRNCTRVIDNNVCHGCWNDIRYSFDREDWHWCPRHKGTQREFECSRSITPDMVIRSIQKTIMEKSRSENKSTT